MQRTRSGKADRNFSDARSGCATSGRGEIGISPRTHLRQQANPDTPPHGSAADRKFWFEQGFDTGDTEVRDTEVRDTWVCAPRSVTPLRRS
jgi:predicted metalloprotease